MDFCDFLNDVSGNWDKAHSKIEQEKSDHFIINNKNTNCLSPQIVGDFITKDEFIQREIHNGYYSLDLTFYKKSEWTDMLLKSKSSRNLDYCEKDIYVEYICINGKITDTIYYENGNIKGSEKIQLDNLRDNWK